MFTTISVHWLNEGQQNATMDIFKTNTVLARKQEGFISRDILIAVDDPMKITTVTSWQTKEQLETWAKNPDRPKRPQGSAPLFANMEIVVYEDVAVP